jgi:hypothetical protein
VSGPRRLLAVPLALMCALVSASCSISTEQVEADGRPTAEVPALCRVLRSEWWDERPAEARTFVQLLRAPIEGDVHLLVAQFGYSRMAVGRKGLEPYRPALDYMVDKFLAQTEGSDERPPKLTPEVEESARRIDQALDDGLCDPPERPR